MNHIVAVIRVNIAQSLLAFFSLPTILISLQELVLQETWLFHYAVTQNRVSYCCSSMSVQYISVEETFHTMHATVLLL